MRLWQKSVITPSIYPHFSLSTRVLEFHTCLWPPGIDYTPQLPLLLLTRFWPMGSHWKWYMQRLGHILKNQGLALCCFPRFLPGGAAILDSDVEAPCWEGQGHGRGVVQMPWHCGPTITSHSPSTSKAFTFDRNKIPPYLSHFHFLFLVIHSWT